MSVILGIDLGTTNSCCCFIENNSPVLVPNKEGSRVTPSVVAFTEKKEIFVGHIAKRQAITNPENTVYGIKRLIGRKFDSKEVQSMLDTLPYKVIAADNGDAWVEIRGEKYSPQEISAFILRSLKESAEEYIGQEVKEAIITVPAYFNDAQRQATKDAGRIAGLEVLRIINEPTAAALSYRDNNLKGKVAVYDLGGGTFDISILDVSEDVYEVLSTSGNTFLGGDDFDKKIMDWIIDSFKKSQGIDLSEDKMALQRLKEAAEKAKCELSVSEEVEINLPFIAADDTGPKHFVSTLTREQFNEMVKDLVEKTLEPCEEALRLANLKKEDIDHIILVGGQTRTPLIIETVREFFGKEPRRDNNPDEVVAIGAALQGSIISGDVKDIVLLDITPLSLGVETKGGLFVKLIERGSTIPTKASQVFTTVTHNQSKVAIHVLQGESELAKNNISLGYFELVDIPPAPKGVPRIEVTFEIDANGIVNVSAVDLDSGKSQSMEIRPSSGLSEKQIQEIIEKAERNREEEIRLKKIIMTKNSIESLLSNIEKSYAQFKGQIPDEFKEKVRNSIWEAKNALKVDDIEVLEDVLADLKQISNKFTNFLLYGNLN